MIILVFFAFVAGVITILSPCILPILPVVLSSSLWGRDDKLRPWGVAVGFVLTFTLATLVLSSLVTWTGISADALRLFAILVVGLSGLVLIVPKFAQVMEQLFSTLSSKSGTAKGGVWGGVLTGVSIGLLWAPCTGPIMASVIALAASGRVGLDTFLITLAYALGTAVPMVAVISGGRKVLNSNVWLSKNMANIQKGFGVLMILTAVALKLNWDRSFQTWILNKFPQYGTGLTKVEDTSVVKNNLDNLKSQTENNGLLVAPELIAGGKWFNSPPLTLAQLRGKVVLIDFWTYSCINCQRTLPYLRNWWDKYKDKGLVIIGVHSPEFEFEKNPDNVAMAIKDFHLEYPIMQDNNFQTWSAYNNQYWPAKYLIGKDGKVRFTHFGEGDYDKTEQNIQMLLDEAGMKGVDQSVNNPTYQVYGQTPETYLGYDRIENVANSSQIHLDKKTTYTLEGNLANDYAAFVGDWTVGKQSAHPETGSKLELNFNAKEVYLVMGTKGKSGKVKVLVDGKQMYQGQDSVDGVVTVQANRLYKLVMMDKPGRHTLTLIFEDGNVDVYAFTFG